MKRGVCKTLYSVAALVLLVTFALVAGKIFLQQQTIERLEERITGLESLEGRFASIEATSSWPMRFETSTRVPVTYPSLECFLQDMYDRVVENEDFGYACERDFHNNPLLGYLFLEAHSQIDGENDKVKSHPFDVILAQQAKVWDQTRFQEPYLTYDVTYSKPED